MSYLCGSLVVGAAILALIWLNWPKKGRERNDDDDEADFWQCWEDWTGIDGGREPDWYIVTPIVLQRFAESIGKPVEDLTRVERNMAILADLAHETARMTVQRRNDV